MKFVMIKLAEPEKTAELAFDPAMPVPRPRPTPPCTTQPRS